MRGLRTGSAGLGVLLLGFLLAAPVGAQDKVSTPPVPEPYKDKRILPNSTKAIPSATDSVTDSGADDADGPAGAESWPYAVPFDSAEVQPRPVPADLERYRADSRYRYDEAGPQARGPSLWERFLEWLEDVLFVPMREATGPVFWQIVRFLLAVLVIGYLLSRLLGVNVGGLFRKHAGGPDAGAAGPLLDVEDIEAVDLDALLGQAEAAGRYRDAVRYRYLRVLQHLAAAGLVAWQKHKTNGTYLREVRAGADRRLGDPFAEVTRLFEWVWYGEAEVDAATAARIARRFARLDALLADHRPVEV